MLVCSIQGFLRSTCMQAYTTIEDVTSRTTPTQTFGIDSNRHLKGFGLFFPLYDGVSVVSFMATIGDVQVHGIVKDKQQAYHDYDGAVSKGAPAGHLLQLPEASD